MKLPADPTQLEDESWYAPFPRLLSRPMAKALAGTAVTPNQLTVINVVCSVAAIVAWTQPFVGAIILGHILMQLNFLFDTADGELARAKEQFSKLGVFIDQLGHRLVDPLIWVAVGLQMMSSGSPIWAFLLAFGCGWVHLFWISLGDQFRGMLYSMIVEAPVGVSRKFVGEVTTVTEMISPTESAATHLAKKLATIVLDRCTVTFAVTLTMLIDYYTDGFAWRLGVTGVYAVVLLMQLLYSITTRAHWLAGAGTEAPPP